jgi:ABC-type uncharacterized transport system substrate-binding protein
MRPLRVPLSALTFAVLASIATPSSGKGFVVVRKAGAGSNVRIATSLVDALAGQQGATTRVIDLSGDGVADAARVARETGDGQVVFAVGPDAVVAAGDGSRAHVIAIGVPNPARLRTTATFVSVYPSGARIFEFASRRLGATRVGFLFSPSQNLETANEFSKAAAANGFTFVPLPAASPGELFRVLRVGLAKVDVLILPVDPLLFDRMSLRLIVERCVAANVPTIGFLPELPALGVTASVVPHPAAVAAAALREGGAARPASRKQIEVDQLQITVSRRAAELIGIKAESLGADIIQ